MYDDSSAAESADVVGDGNTETEEDVDDDDEDDDDDASGGGGGGDSDSESGRNSPVIPKPTQSQTSSGGASGSSSKSYVMVDALTDDDDTEAGRQFVKVELSVSETRPVRSSGSGEEDANDEEPASFSTVTVPPSSINSYSQSVQRRLADASQDTANGSDGLWCFLFLFLFLIHRDIISI